MAHPKWPFMGANQQWDADQISSIPLYKEAKAAGVKLTGMWYGEFPTAPSRINSSYDGAARAIEQFEAATPGMRAMRQLFNQWHLPDPANGFYHPKSNGFIDRMVSGGWHILWVLMDGPSQRSYEGLPGAGTWLKSYPVQADIIANPAGTFEEVMTLIHQGQVTSWTRLLTYLQHRPDVLGQTLGFELVNEPGTYSSAGDRTRNTVLAMTRYVQHCIALVDLIDDMLPGNGIDIYVGGWRYSADLNILHSTYLPHYGKTAFEALVDRIGMDRFVWSQHLYPGWIETPCRDMDDLVAGIEPRSSIPRKMGLRIALTEMNAQNEHANNVTYPMGDVRKGFMLSRHTHYFRENNISVFWWPYANWAAGSVIDARGNLSGIQNYHQNSLYMAINLWAQNNNPDWFTGPDSGARQATFVEAAMGSVNDPSDPDYAAKLVGSDSRDNVPGYGLGFGGRGVAVVQPLENCNNFLYGGNGRNILYASQNNDDYLSLGRGGGVARLYGGYSYCNTNGGQNLIYGGSKWCQISCYWGVNTVVVDPAAVTTIIGWNPARGDKLSFKGAFASSLDFRFATRRESPPNNILNEQDLVVAFPQGGTLRLIHGAQHSQTLPNHVLDFTTGWYWPGWTEPADYSTADFALPLVEPVDGPEPPAAQIRLHGYAGAPFTGFFNHLGQPVEIP